MQVYDPGETDPGALQAQTAQGHIHHHHPHAPALQTADGQGRPARSRKRVAFEEAQVRWTCMQQFNRCPPGCLLPCFMSDLELHTKARQHDPKHSQRRPRKTWGQWQLGPAGAALPSKATLCLLQDFVESRRQVLAVPPPAIAPLPFSACMPESETQTSETPVCCGFRCLQHVISISNSTGRETRARASCLCNHWSACKLQTLQTHRHCCVLMQVPATSSLAAPPLANAAVLPAAGGLHTSSVTGISV